MTPPKLPGKGWGRVDFLPEGRLPAKGVVALRVFLLEGALRVSGRQWLAYVFRLMPINIEPLGFVNVSAS